MAGDVRVAKTFIEKNCLSCHSTAKKAGGFDLEKLAAQPDRRGSFLAWKLVHDRMQAGEMPPAKQPRPPAPEMRAMLKNLAADLAEIERKKQPNPGSTMMRDYQNPSASEWTWPFIFCIGERGMSIP